MAHLAPFLALDRRRGENPMEEMTRAAAYWLLARVGGAEEVAALRAFDERHRIAGGRSRLCASTEAAGTYGP